MPSCSVGRIERPGSPWDRDPQAQRGLAGTCGSMSRDARGRPGDMEPVMSETLQRLEQAQVGVHRCTRALYALLEFARSDASRLPPPRHLELFEPPERSVLDLFLSECHEPDGLGILAHDHESWINGEVARLLTELGSAWASLLPLTDRHALSALIAALPEHVSWAGIEAPSPV